MLDFAKARKWRSGENPAAWRGHLALILPKRTKRSRGHFASMPYASLPEFVQLLRGSPHQTEPSLTAPHHTPPNPAEPCPTAPGEAPCMTRAPKSTVQLALQFLILTACRSGEVLGAQWSEFDLDAKVWTIPASRMKAGVEHRVPLSGPALAIVKLQNRASAQVFPISARALSSLHESFKLAATIHGFRSSFRDWCGNETNFPREIAEQALAHSVGNATEAAYRRSDALERRRALMEAWAAYCGPPMRNVISIRA